MPTIKDMQDMENAKALRKLAAKVSVFASEVRLLPPEDAVAKIKQLRSELALVYKQLGAFNTHMRQGKDVYDLLGRAAGKIREGQADAALGMLQGASSSLQRLAALVVEPRGQRSAVIKAAIAHGVRRTRG